MHDPSNRGPSGRVNPMENQKPLKVYCWPGRGFYSLIIDNIDAIKLRDERSFSLSSGSLEMLYLNWLNELLFCFETELLVLTDFEIHLSDHHLTGTARGEVLDIRRHQTHFNVKAITYHQLQVSRTHQGWLAEVILDI